MRQTYFPSGQWRRANLYPRMHYSGIPSHTKSMKAQKFWSVCLGITVRRCIVMWYVVTMTPDMGRHTRPTCRDFSSCLLSLSRSSAMCSSSASLSLSFWASLSDDGPCRSEVRILLTSSATFPMSPCESGSASTVYIKHKGPYTLHRKLQRFFL